MIAVSDDHYCMTEYLDEHACNIQPAACFTMVRTILCSYDTDLKMAYWPVEKVTCVFVHSAASWGDANDAIANESWAMCNVCMAAWQEHDSISCMITHVLTM